MTLARLVTGCLFAFSLTACEDKTKLSISQATNHVDVLVKTAAADVAEIRQGLPLGVKFVEPLWKDGSGPEDDLQAARESLERARQKVQDLRVAKSTFFALALADGMVLRNDQEQDRMAGKNIFDAFPGLRPALTGGYTEARGSMKEAAGVAEPRRDAQWVAAVPVKSAGATKGLYVTGWSWSSYAYRLEFKVRADIRAELLKAQDRSRNEPLVYVFVAVGHDVYAAPMSPDVNIEAVKKADLVGKAKGDAVYSQAIDLTGREFGLAARRAPALGSDVAIAVLRSET